MAGLGEIFRLGIPWSHLLIRAVLIYIVFFIGLRLFGKRELGQFTTFDLVLVLLVANALQPARSCCSSTAAWRCYAADGHGSIAWSSRHRRWWSRTVSW